MAAGRPKKDRRAISSCRPISLPRPQVNVKLLVGTIEARQDDPNCLDIDIIIINRRRRHRTTFIQLLLCSTMTTKRPIAVRAETKAATTAGRENKRKRHPADDQKQDALGMKAMTASS
jgi:hypothetical protein